VKMFNWIFTLFRGKLTFSTPLLFALAYKIHPSPHGSLKIRSALWAW